MLDAHLGLIRIRCTLVRIRHTIEMVQIRARLVFLPQDPAAEPPGQHRLPLIAGVSLGRHREYVVQLFECPLFGLGYEQEDEEERYEVQSCIEPERTRRGHGAQHARESERQHRGPEVVGGDGPCHSDLTMREGEDFGAVHEWDRSFTGTVEGCEEVDEQCHQSEPQFAVFNARLNEEAQSSGYPSG